MRKQTENYLLFINLWKPWVIEIVFWFLFSNTFIYFLNKFLKKSFQKTDEQKIFTQGIDKTRCTPTQLYYITYNTQ